MGLDTGKKSEVAANRETATGRERYRDNAPPKDATAASDSGPSLRSRISPNETRITTNEPISFREAGERERERERENQRKRTASGVYILSMSLCKLL